jgi:hypothetical protein
MGSGEFARGRGAGQESLQAARPVSGSPHPDTASTSDSLDGAKIPKKSVRVWESAYRQYGRAWETTARSGKEDLAAAQEMAAASRAVAAAWRQIASATTLPWWALAAIASAAGAFESQARDYETRDNGKEA